MASADWHAGKEDFDMQAAERVIDRLWSDKKTAQLKNLVSEPENTVFISQPSTSETNVIPICFAERLAREFGATYLVGDDHFTALHSQQAKHMTRVQRIFNRREYEPLDAEGFKECIGNKKAVIVEDILTTGGSVAEFARCLGDLGVSVRSVAGLMGDRRLNIDQKTRLRLQRALDEKGIPAGDLYGMLTRTEAGSLIMILNNVRTEHARKKLARNIQGLQDSRTFKGLGRDPETRGYPSAEGNDRGHESASQGVPAGAVLSGGQPREVAGFFKIGVTCDEGGCMRELTTEVFVRPGLDRDQVKAALRKEAERFVGENARDLRTENIKVVIRPAGKRIEPRIEKGRGL
jgi:hypothetical protein